MPQHQNNIQAIPNDAASRTRGNLNSMQIDGCNTSAFLGVVPSALAHETPRTVGRVGVVGANEISLCIVVKLLDADVPVTLFEPERNSLDEVVLLARTGYQAAVARGELGLFERDRRMALLAGTVNFHHLKDCDLIVDTISTDSASKEKLFRRLDQVAKQDAVLATLASNVSVDHIAGCTRRSRDVLGLHVSRSPTIGEVWKLVPGRDTSDVTLNTVIALARKIQQKAALADLCHESEFGAKSTVLDTDRLAS
jgi:3-hydroxyacyl-CoA dehydrogenase